MKNNILQHYVDLKIEAKDIAQRIAKFRRLPNGTGEWNAIKGAAIKGLEEEYTRQYARIYEEQLKIEKKIENLEPVEKLIIRLRYFDRMEWEAIFMRIHYSQRQTFRIHKGILEKLHKD